MRIETFLPAFPGFYNSLIDGDDDIESELHETGQSYDEIEIDWKQYQNDVSIACCDIIADKLSEFVGAIKFQELRSPKYYNYSTDSVNCEIILLKCHVKAIRDYLYANQTEFKQYLKDHYTSCSGFISHYANDWESWNEYTQNFRNYRDNGHYLGAILEFICENEEIDHMTLYYGIKEGHGIYASSYITEIESE